MKKSMRKAKLNKKHVLLKCVLQKTRFLRAAAFACVFLLFLGGCAGNTDTADMSDADMDTAGNAGEEANENEGSDTPPGEGWEIVEEENIPQQNAENTPADTETTYLSILGDSISTFDDWIPEGYYDFYPMNGAVADVGQTWWKMVLDDTGMQLCVNGSSSGSTCAGDSTGTADPQHGCSDFRINGLTAADGSIPDVIIVYMGTNDFIKAVPLGDNDGTKAVAEGSIENFSDAYCLILDKLHVRYPDAQIFCCKLMPVGVVGADMTYEPFVNEQGMTIDSYSRQIETIAEAKGYPLIDLENCGMTMENMIQYVSDGVHLNPEGMKLIRDAVEAVIAGN